MSLGSRDREVLWHPYTQMQTAEPPIGIVRGEGAELVAEDGRRYLDAIASWWVNLHGHGHPVIAERVAKQARELEHVIFAGFTHAPAVDLGERLVDLLPGEQRRVFYSDNGSTAVEVALKMAIQYWRHQGAPRRRFVALRGSYHGDTFGAMSASSRSTFTAPFTEQLFEVAFVDVPHEDDIEAVEAALEKELARGDVAGFVFEPLLQGVAGFVTYPASCLERLIGCCRRHDVLAIADEVLTGFGRTGPLFACERLADPPDIFCLSKGITGGTMALGATTTTESIFEAFLSEDWDRAFFHGHSYTANPLACAAALASLDLLLAPECTARRRAIEESHAAFVEKVKGRPGLRDVRHIGTALAVELDTGGDTSYFNEIGPELAKYYLEQGVLLRPLGNVFYTLPPYCVTDEQLARIHGLLEEGVSRAAASCSER